MLGRVLRTRADGYRIVDDPAAVDVETLHAWLDADAYWWPQGLQREVLDRALAGSLTLTVLDPDGVMAGFGRVVSDRATFAYWCDVYVEPAHRGRGLGRWLTEAFVEHPDLATCRRLMLATRDAHDVYAPAGFSALARPEIFMEINRPLAGASRLEG
jgi:GNAT superfamily N-acetyltransferase